MGMDAVTTVRDLLQIKGNAVWAISPDSPLKEALALMADKDVGALLVMEDCKAVGIFSERDYARLVVSAESFSMGTPVKELMTHPIFYVTPEQTIEECMALMSSKRFRHLPVMDGECLGGVISIGDIVKQLIFERDITIKDLEDYIWVHMI
jgi:CBS domain-containing protein